MPPDMQLRHDELTDNPNARVPISLVLDTSGSMEGENLRELNAAVAWFLDAVRKDPMASISAETSIVTFGGRVVQHNEFMGVGRQPVPAFTAHGNTPMGEAVVQALNSLEQAKRVYSQMGVDYYQPWLVLMTDGEPTDSIAEAVSKCRTLVDTRKLTVFPVGVGASANLKTLGMFSPRLEPLRMGSTDLRRFFAWLSASIKKASLSNPGDRPSANLGENEFRKMSVDWNTAFQTKGRL